MKEYIENQRKIKNNIIKAYKSGQYNLENPLVYIDPFDATPLGAMVLFRGEALEYRITIGEISYTIYQENEDKIINVVALSPLENKVLIQGIKGGKVIEEGIVTIVTKELPKEFDSLKVIKINEEQKSRDYIGLNLATTKGRAPFKNLCSILDWRGEVKWYYSQRAWNLLKQLKNGNIIVDAPVKIEGTQRYIPKGFIEITLLGEVKNYFEVPNGLHHDVFEMENGNFLVLTNNDDSLEDVVLEIHRESKKVIDKIDFKEILDKDRTPGLDKEVVNPPLDWLHLNSVFSKGDFIIVSSRNQNIVVKINKKTREIIWIFGSPENFKEEYKKYLLTPMGERFEYSWAQHSAFLDAYGDLYLFDNGNFRSYDLETSKLAYENYSRGVKYRINEENMSVYELWQYGKERGNRLKCPYLGSTSLQKNGNALICFGGILKDRFGNPVDDLGAGILKASATIVEVKGNDVVFELSISNKDRRTDDGFVCYRAEKIDLLKYEEG
ncbi:MAG: aryl-sulfate sulfotransferase [Clostridium sp.]